MEKEILLVAIIGIILLISIIQAVQLNTIAAKIIGEASNGGLQGSSTGDVDTSQMTENEKMNYEMHGIVPERFSSGSSSLQSLPNMVGGC